MLMATKLIEAKEVATTKDAASYLLDTLNAIDDALEGHSGGTRTPVEIEKAMKDAMEKSLGSAGSAMPASKAGQLAREFAQDLSKFGIKSESAPGKGEGSGSGSGSEGNGPGQESIFDLLSELAGHMYAEVDAVYGKKKDSSLEVHAQLMTKVEDGIKKLAEKVASLVEKSAKDNESAQRGVDESARKGKDDISKLMEAAKKQILDDAVEIEKQIDKSVERAAENAKRAALNAAQEALPKKVEITLSDIKKVEMEAVISGDFEKALKIFHALQIIWLCGPAGSGKTMMAAQFAKALDLPFYAISCTAGISESWFIGRRDINGEYISPEFLNLYENGGVILLDEFDAADPNTGLIVNAAIGNGYLTVPLRTSAPLAKRHPKFYVVFATNTWGFGVDGQYTGREGMDASTRDRAVLGKVYVSYSHAIESKFLPDVKNEGYAVQTWKAKKLQAGLGSTLNKIRDNIRTHNLKRIMSTRAFEQASILKNAGFSDEEIVSIYFTDWSPNELAKGAVGV